MMSRWAHSWRGRGGVWLVAAASLMVAGGRAFAASTAPVASTIELQRFVDAQWTEVQRLKDVDAAVLGDLYPRIGGADWISDRGGPFQAGDIRTGEPMRRFVLGGRSSDRWFVCYEQGGLGHHLVLVIFQDHRSGLLTTIRGAEGRGPVRGARGSPGWRAARRGTGRWRSWPRRGSSCRPGWCRTRSWRDSGAAGPRR